jgi:hypothetical protein
MSKAFLPDLRASEELGARVTIETMRRHYQTALRDLIEDEEYVVIHTPQSMGDTMTTTVLPLLDIVAVTLTHEDPGCGNPRPCSVRHVSITNEPQPCSATIQDEPCGIPVNAAGPYSAKTERNAAMSQDSERRQLHPCLRFPSVDGRQRRVCRSFDEGFKASPSLRYAEGDGNRISIFASGRDF